MDGGQRISEKVLRTIEKKIGITYSQAEEEIKQKLADFAVKHREKNEEMLERLSEGLITKTQYKDWLSVQVFQRKQWEQKLKQVQDVMVHADEVAMDIIREGQFDVFCGNYNFFAKAAKDTIGRSFTLYDSRTAARLISKKPQLLPKWKIDLPKEYKWSQKKAQQAITQGIIQGESIDKITKRLEETLEAQGKDRMRLFARTAITESENAGRMAMLRDAEKMGIKVLKKWLATKDKRTRDSHREMDGETRKVEDAFSNGLMYPGDPSGDPAEVYNCRCTLTYVYPDFL